MTAYHKLKGTNAQRTATNGGAVLIVQYPFISVYLFHGCFSHDTHSINSYLR